MLLLAGILFLCPQTLGMKGVVSALLQGWAGEADFIQNRL